MSAELQNESKYIETLRYAVETAREHFDGRVCVSSKKLAEHSDEYNSRNLGLALGKANDVTAEDLTWGGGSNKEQWLVDKLKEIDIERIASEI